MINRKLNLFNKIEENSSFFIFGPRGVGKSRLIKSTLARLETTPKIEIDLLNTTEYREFIKKPELLYLQVGKQISDTGNAIIVVDEVQKIPELLNEVHRCIEEFRDKVCFILTGSSARKLRRSGANLLAGRALTFNLYPFTSDEIDIDIDEALQFGTIPLISASKNKVATLKSYINNYIAQEIKQEAIVRNLEPFIRFIELAGQFNGKQINYTSIGKQVGATTKTVIDYFSILEDTLIATKVEPWSYSVIKQIAQSPRYYLFDCGVLNALSGELRTELRQETYRYGNLFETFIINEIIRKNNYEELENKFSYLRLHSGLEVDLIISSRLGVPVRLIEIKSKSSPEQSDVNNLLAAKEFFPNAKLFCLCNSTRAYQLGEVEVLPWKLGLEKVLA